MTSKQTSWTYRSLAWVTPELAGWVFCGSVLLTIFLFSFAINESSTQRTYSDLFMVMLLFTILAGTFALFAWYIDRYEKDEDTRIQSRYYLHFGVFMGITWMVITFARFALK